MYIRTVLIIGESNSYDYAFEFKSSNLRFGPGVTKEVGQDLINMGVSKVCVITDSNLVNLPPVSKTLDVSKTNQIHMFFFF